MGAFCDFIGDKSVRLVGAESRKSIDTDMRAATLAKGSTGIFHGMKSVFCRMILVRLMRYIQFQQGLIIPEWVLNTLCYGKQNVLNMLI